MTRRYTRKREAAARLETLEDRRMLAVFGEAWPDARNLTISFPADGVEVGNDKNDINALLDLVAARQDWQELVLRAYQTWSIHADINIGLRNDYDLAFGTPGLISGDPRFGEFRIGAFPQVGLVANSLPFQAVAGTYSGDLVLNSNEQFTFHDWANDQAPDPSTINGNERDLFSLLLHETGNSLGLDDNLQPWSVMFRQYTVPKGVLAAEDIANIEAIYGQRSDPFETTNNDGLHIAELIPTPVGLDPNQDVIRSRGSLANSGDVDVYKFIPVAGSDSVTIRVRAVGVSLLQSKLEIVDAAGQVLNQISATSVFDNDNELTINGISGHSELYLRVSAADASSIYSIGDYWVEVDYRSVATRASDLTAGSYDAGADSLFANFDLNDAEAGSNDAIADAEILTASAVTAAHYYELESSVSSVADVDYFKITSPAVASERLVVHLAGVGATRPDVRLKVVDATGQPVGTAACLRDDGTFTVVVSNPAVSQDYFLQISVDPNSTVGVGNYVAVAEFEPSLTQMNDLVSGSLTAATDRYVRWTAGKTRLFRFDLHAAGTFADQAIRLTIYDAHSRKIKAVAVARNGVTQSILAWLQRGEYILRFTALSATTASDVAINYSLCVDGISDDQDDDTYDPDYDPNYDPYNYSDTEVDASYYDVPGYADPDYDEYGYDYYDYYSAP